jgi:hypothetical protein
MQAPGLGLTYGIDPSVTHTRITLPLPVSRRQGHWHQSHLHQAYILSMSTGWPAPESLTPQLLTPPPCPYPVQAPGLASIQEVPTPLTGGLAGGGAGVGLQQVKTAGGGAIGPPGMGPSMLINKQNLSMRKNPYHSSKCVPS